MGARAPTLGPLLARVALASGAALSAAFDVDDEGNYDDEDEDADTSAAHLVKDAMDAIIYLFRQSPEAAEEAGRTTLVCEMLLQLGTRRCARGAACERYHLLCGGARRMVLKRLGEGFDEARGAERGEGTGMLTACLRDMLQLVSDGRGAGDVWGDEGLVGAVVGCLAEGGDRVSLVAVEIALELCKARRGAAGGGEGSGGGEAGATDGGEAGGGGGEDKQQSGSRQDGEGGSSAGGSGSSGAGGGWADFGSWEERSAKEQLLSSLWLCLGMGIGSEEGYIAGTAQKRAETQPDAETMLLWGAAAQALCSLVDGEAAARVVLEAAARASADWDGLLMDSLWLTTTGGAADDLWGVAWFRVWRSSSEFSFCIVRAC